MEKLFELGIKRFYLRSNGTSRETEQAPGISLMTLNEFTKLLILAQIWNNWKYQEMLFITLLKNIHS